MKRVIIIIIGLLMLIGIVGCGNKQISTIYANGIMKEYKLAINDTIKEIRFAMPAKLYLSSEESDKIRWTIDENLAEHIHISFEQGVLIIETNQGVLFDLKNSGGIRFYVGTNGLRKMSTSGMTEVISQGVLQVETLQVAMSGISTISQMQVNAKSIDINIKDLSMIKNAIFNANELNMNVNGISTMTASSESAVDSVNIECSGTSNIDIGNIKAILGTVKISGSSIIRVNIQNLTSNISGSSQIINLADEQSTQKHTIPHF